MPLLAVLAGQDAAGRVGRCVARVDADAFEQGHMQQQGQPLAELGAPGNHYRIASFGDGRAPPYLVLPLQVAPLRLQRVAQVSPVYLQAAYRVGLTLGGSCQCHFHLF